MDIHVKEYEHVTMISISGRLDASAMQRVESFFADQLAAGKTKFVFDLGGLEYISSAGLRVLLGAAKKVRSIQGAMVLAQLTEQVREVFEMSGFTAIFTVYDHIDEAVQALK